MRIYANILSTLFKAFKNYKLTINTNTIGKKTISCGDFLASEVIFQ